VYTYKNNQIRNRSNIGSQYIASILASTIMSVKTDGTKPPTNKYRKTIDKVAKAFNTKHW
jgi:hypothetical protein